MTIPQLSERQYQSFIEQADSGEESVLVELLCAHPTLISMVAQDMRDGYEDRKVLYDEDETTVTPHPPTLVSLLGRSARASRGG